MKSKCTGPGGKLASIDDCNTLLPMSWPSWISSSKALGIHLSKEHKI